MSLNMLAPEMGRIQRIHFIGIGGAGMGGIAEVLINQGYAVSGSDMNGNVVTERLSSLGANIAIGHDPKNVENVDVVVISTAIPDTNPELIAAREARLPVVRRAEMLAELMRFKQGIAVAGTHGKTTTTSLVASLLSEGGLDPTFVIGGLLNSVGSNARLGESPYFVAEADESDASFLYLNPVTAIVTNIDADHMETYGGDFSRLRKAFLEFLHHMPFYGLAVLCIDDPVVREMIPEVSRPIVTYGFSEDADVRAYDFMQKGFQCHFKVQRKRDPKPIEITLNLPGEHNALNATAAIAVARELKVKNESIIKALSEFSGIGRRMQVYGDLNINNKKAFLIDDYGHHPREVLATIKAMRLAYPGKRLVMAYQPHRFTRTRDLFDDFVQVLSEIDVLLLLDVYSAGEKHIPHSDGRSLSQAIRQFGKIEPIFVEQTSDLAGVLENIIESDDILLTLGAGSIGALAAEIAAKYGE